MLDMELGPRSWGWSLKKMKNVSEELWAGWWKTPIHVVSKNDNFIIFGLRPFFVRVRGTVGHDVFPWQKSYGEELFQTFLSYGWGNPVTDGWCFGRHDVQRRTEKKSNMPVQFNGEIDS